MEKGGINDKSKTTSLDPTDITRLNLLIARSFLTTTMIKNT